MSGLTPPPIERSDSPFPIYPVHNDSRLQSLSEDVKIMKQQLDRMEQLLNRLTMFGTIEPKEPLSLDGRVDKSIITYPVLTLAEQLGDTGVPVETPPEPSKLEDRIDKVLTQVWMSRGSKPEEALRAIPSFTETLLTAPSPALNYPAAITSMRWANAATFIKTFPKSLELEAYLKKPCPFYPGKVVEQTHCVFPLIKTIILDGQECPCTLNTLHRLDQKAKGNGVKQQLNGILHAGLDDPLESDCHWGLMLQGVAPETRAKQYNEQKKIITDKGYRVPGYLEAALGILWTYRMGERLFGDNPLTYTVCKEEIKGDHVIVGNFVFETGLTIRNSGSGSAQCMGMTGLLTF